MSPLSAAAVLDLWDRGQDLPWSERSLLLLAAALVPETPEEIAGWSVGRRDGLVLTLRERLFGSRMRCVIICPSCGERLELDFATTDIRVDASEVEGPLTLSLDGYEVSFRLPDSWDLRAVALGEDETAVRARRLLGRCVLAAHFGEESVAGTDLPDAVVAEIDRRMAEADPQADIRITLSCPACDHAWHALLDIGTFLWTEIEAWAARILREVHSLAAAYGWREADILALSARRRQHYLDMVNA